MVNENKHQRKLGNKGRLERPKGRDMKIGMDSRRTITLGHYCNPAPLPYPHHHHHLNFPICTTGPPGYSYHLSSPMSRSILFDIFNVKQQQRNRRSPRDREAEGSRGTPLWRADIHVRILELTSTYQGRIPMEIW
jgi:hypothetical protein